MKNIMILWGLLLHAGILCACPFDNGLSASAFSKELPTITGSCSISFMISAYRDGITLHQLSNTSVPKNWQITLSNPTNIVLDSGQTATITATVTYPVLNLPFYPQSIGFYLYSQEENSLEIDSMEVEAKIYFTPYNTVEIWDIDEFAALLRNWLPPQNPMPDRIYMSKETIPVSNIPNNFEPTNEAEAQFEPVFLKGLAYSIPMMASPQDTTENDTTVYKDGCGFTKQRYIFDVQGRLVADYKRGADIIQIPLKGLRIEVRDWDSGQDDILAVLESDEKGLFVAQGINTCQPIIGENDDLEIYLRIFAENTTYDIRGVIKGQNHTCYANSNEIILPYNNGLASNNPVDFGDINLAEETFKGVHFAVLQYDFVNIQYQQVGSSYTLPPGLELRTHQTTTSHFSPIPTNTIYYTTHTAGHETVPFHEFGHFLMWHLQMGIWGNPLNCSFLNHSFYNEIPECGAWTEGWADAISFICDVYYAEKDSEWTDHAMMHFEIVDSASSNFQTINNGFKAEYFVAAALYDLWDGPNNFTHIQNAVILNSISFNDKSVPPQAYDWAAEDDLSYHFTQIADALRPFGSGGADINTNIVEFYYHFVENMVCNERANVKRCFNENLIRRDVEDMGQSVSSDELKYTNSFNSTNIGVDIGLMTTNNDVFNLNNTVLPGHNYLSDDLRIRNNGKLYINANLPFGYDNAISTSYPTPNSTPFEVYTCGNAAIKVYDYGELEVGNINQSQNYSANLIIKSGCSLSLSDHGHLTIHNNSKLDMIML